MKNLIINYLIKYGTTFMTAQLKIKMFQVKFQTNKNPKICNIFHDKVINRLLIVPKNYLSVNLIKYHQEYHCKNSL